MLVLHPLEGRSLLFSQVVDIKVHFLALRKFFHRRLFHFFVRIRHESVFLSEDRLQVLYVEQLMVFGRFLVEYWYAKSVNLIILALQRLQ